MSDFTLSVQSLLEICADKHNQALARVQQLEHENEKLKRQLQEAQTKGETKP